ncbi:MAG: hypothetical protein J6W64_09885 [Bacilli bacterium]|nr:hypothetical protein [Bacilli bacterium]MBO7504722.1 hypothetical protein [bacterium]
MTTELIIFIIIGLLLEIGILMIYNQLTLIYSQLEVLSTAYILKEINFVKEDNDNENI